MDDKKITLFKLTPEAKVGLFVLMGIALLVYMSLRLGGIKLGREDGYTLYVSFASAAGLDKDAAVRVAGVEIGKVKKISLKDNKASLMLLINADTKVGKDFTAVLTTKGLLGEKYLELIPGSPNAPPLKDGDSITRTVTYADMDKLMTVLSEVAVDIKQVTETLSKVLGGKDGEQSLRNIVKNIEDITFRVDRLIASNDERLTRIVSNVDSFTTLLKEDGPQISAELRQAIKNMNEAFIKTSTNLNQMIDENRGDVKEGVANLKAASVKLQEAMDNFNKLTKDVGPRISDTVNSIGSIAKKIDKGEGTLGKLVNDTSLHEGLNKTVKGINTYIDKTENIHTYVGYRGEYLFDAANTKSYVSVRIQPKADKYYLLEVIDDPRGKKKTETKVIQTGNTTTTREETTTSDQIKFSLQMAKRFSDFVIRGGLLESTGGFGMDYYLFKDRLKLSAEAFDFSKKSNPHLKAGGALYFSKYFYLTAGGDDFISRRGFASFYVGLGFTFDDDDLKYLVGSTPAAALKN